ncbi:MAG: hypothetical protein OXF72_01155 [Gammaproteobacteria bacterium]|nr:hypothetical protein [Gammaproteobacteria bacterium]
MLPVSARVSEAISRHRPLDEMTRLARDEGLSSLREQGLALVSAGLTSLQEVNRVCQ